VRIVAGEWGGRRLKRPADDRVRPTADRVREAWMSIVQPDLLDARVLDLFAGSGALGLEALSRGATSAEFVESAPKSFAALVENVETLGAADRAVLHRTDAMKFASRLDAGRFDIAFADPPYRMGFAQRLAALWLATPFARVIGIEHERDVTLEGADRRTYGDTVVSFYRAT
jgi:16S rRNA (guanine966-N2)-methyltransferase